MKQWDKVKWLHQPGDSYGYVVPIAGTIVKINAKTVKIAVWSLIDGRIHYRNVKREHVILRTEHAMVDDAFSVEVEP